MLPIVFLTAAALMLLLALIAFWQSVRALFGRGVDEISAAIGGDRAALIDEKNALLRALKDIDYERAAGKIGEADWKRLDASYRARAKDVLAALDKDLGPWRAKAEKLAQERFGKSVEPYRRASARSEQAAPTCRTCAAVNEPDAVFCKKCAARLEDGPEERAPESAAEETS